MAVVNGNNDKRYTFSTGGDSDSEKAAAEAKAKAEREAAERKAAEDRRKELEQRRKELLTRNAGQAEAPAPKLNGPAARAVTMLNKGGFTRRLTWRNRRQLRRLEQATDVLRACIRDLFSDGENGFVVEAMDALAALEVAARLERMKDNQAAK